MYEKIIKNINPKNNRFLLIKSTRAGFWSDMSNVFGKLLLAEITNRCPVVFWGEYSRYSVGKNINSWEEYFLPVSDYPLNDLVNDNYTYYPATWNSSNIYDEDLNKWSWDHREIASFINSDANVVISQTHHCLLYEVLPWVNKGHPVYGLWGDDVFRYIINKYIKLQPNIENEIEEFYNAHLMDKGPVLAVHIRSSDLIKDVPNLKELNAEYPQEINCFLKDNPSARIFLLTDDEAVLEQYKQMYGNILIHTDCNLKTPDGLGPVLQVFPDMKRKGIDIIKDTYLACKCDYFIGNRHSNVSMAISRLKMWEQDRIKMFWYPRPS